MPAEYRIDIKTTAGVKVAELKNALLSLSLSQRVNAPGMAEFTLSQDDPNTAYLLDKYQVEIWRRWPAEDIAWYKLFDTILRDTIYYTTGDGLRQVAARTFGPLHLLTWRENLYAADTTNRTKFTSAKPETILKTLVQYNCTSSGTTGAGRDRNATNAGAINGFTVTIETDSARGVAMDYSSTRNVVLDDLQKIQQANVNSATPFDFDLVKQSGATYQFQFKTPYLGTDRTASVIFSEAFDNLRNARLEYIRSTEKTAIVVGGGGTGSSRAVVTRTGANYNSSANDIEHFYNGASTTGGTTTAATLNALGDREAEATRMRPMLSFDVAQKTFLYGRDYFLGDACAAHYGGVDVDVQVVAASLSWRPDGDEDIKIDVRGL